MAFQQDLIVLAADITIESTLRGLLTRSESLRIRPLSADFAVNVEHDPGCLRNASAYLRPYLRTHAHALVVFDREGSGREECDRNTLETVVETDLASNGWQGRGRAIVIDPELEAWVWSDSPEVDAALGWAGRSPPLRQWLRQESLWRDDALKPPCPKETMKRAMFLVRKPYSAAVYAELAKRVGLRRCTDAAFHKLCATLAEWFGQP